MYLLNRKVFDTNRSEFFISVNLNIASRNRGPKYVTQRRIIHRYTEN